MILHIKHMVSSRCITAVKTELSYMKINSPKVELGSVEIDGNLTSQESDLLQERLHAVGMELIQDQKTILSNRIKLFIDELLNSQDENSDLHISVYLKNKLKMDYIQIVRIFADRNSLTLKQYIIGERVNKVKQLIRDHTGSLTEIAEQMQYSSSAHLCNELKRVTGNTPKSYK